MPWNGVLHVVFGVLVYPSRPRFRASMPCTVHPTRCEDATAASMRAAGPHRLMPCYGWCYVVLGNACIPLERARRNGIPADIRTDRYSIPAMHSTPHTL